MPEVEIDIDDLLEISSDDERASKLQVCSCSCGFSREDWLSQRKSEVLLRLLA